MREKLIKYLDKAFISLMAINLVLVVLGSAFILSDRVFVKDAEKTKGYISHVEKQDDGEKKYMLFYFANGNRYTTEYKFVDKDTYIGEEMAVYYNPENAEDIYIKTNSVWYVLAYLGLGLAAAEAIAYLPLKKREVIYKNNIKAICRVIEIKPSWFTGKVIVCESSSVPERKGKPFLSGSVNKKYAKSVKNKSMTVYYHPKNPNIYIVDTK